MISFILISSIYVFLIFKAFFFIGWLYSHFVHYFENILDTWVICLYFNSEAAFVHHKDLNIDLLFVRLNLTIMFYNLTVATTGFFCYSSN